LPSHYIARVYKTVESSCWLINIIAI
jgi:hypothetical protein